MTPALRLAVEHAIEFEQFRAWPYPDPASPLARATPYVRWGYSSAVALLGLLPPTVVALSGAPWTQGYGQTGPGVRPANEAWRESVARVNLEDRIEDLIAVIAARAGRPLEAGQMAALAGFMDNVGPGKFGVKDGLFALKNAQRPSTLWLHVQAGRDAQAADAFLQWTKAQGRVMRGLVRRREAERAMYLRGS